MTETSSNTELPLLSFFKRDDEQLSVQLAGCWNLRSLSMNPTLQKALQQLAKQNIQHWNLLDIDVLDSAAALLLWQTWQEQMPVNLQLKSEHQLLFNRWQQQALPVITSTSFRFRDLYKLWLQTLYDFALQLLGFIGLLGQLLLDTVYVVRHLKEMPWAEVSIAIYEAGVRALGITALVGFLIGIVLSYLSALQLKTFGAEIYIIDILGLSIIRELGPLLAAILVAGRSGSAITAQIGIMRVTEELDALSAMGISHSLRLILPKVTALAIVMPILSTWTSTAALIGGMFSAQNTLDISYQQFLVKLPDVVPLLNVFIGLGKSAVFGVMIALIACHFGFRIKPNTESLGSETTNSVVAAITVVIMIDALFAILFMGIGMP
jgi:phospholipid/cholesterol/gamma-HCH transport system permease protein